MSLWFEYFTDALLDSLKLFPFLFFIYLILEILEHKAGSRIHTLVHETEHAGPVIGAAAGVIPQCGLSSAAVTMYAEGVITLGTLLAIFLSSSDEMLPILISESVNGAVILKILGLKVLIGTVTGYIVDFVLKMVLKKGQDKEMLQPAEHHHGWVFRDVLMDVLKHTIEVFGFILLFSFLINAVFGLVGEARITQLLTSFPLLSEAAAELIGLIPNCASSVIITKLYLSGMIGSGALFSGLLANAGVGTLVLFRVHRHMKQDLLILIFIYLISVLWGLIIGYLPLGL